MNRLEKNTPREDHRFLNPSFSSTLLDKIYRSIDEGERNSVDMNFYRETTVKKQIKTNEKYCNRAMDEEQGKRKDNNVSKKVELAIKTQERQHATKMDRKSHRERERERDHHDQDVVFFSSTSVSSDSSSGSGFSSSDTESMYGLRSRASRASCFAPPRPKKGHAERRRSSTMLYEQKGRTRMFEGCCHNSNTEGVAIHNEEALIKSKSRALKIYNNLKKVKQPISPGGRFTSFLNSLFATGNAKKTRSTCYEDVNAERKAKSGQASTCSSSSSSASSYSRSCLSKTLSSERDKLCNGVKRTVSFYPVSVIVGEDSRPCGQKSLYEEKGTGLLMPVSVPMAWKIGRSPSKKRDEEKSRVVEEAAREFLEGYRFNQKKNDLILKDLPIGKNVNDNEEDDDDDDDAASCASSDLFELDHLAVLGNGRYCEELPVYETTHVSTNRAIANGLVV